MSQQIKMSIIPRHHHRLPCLLPGHTILISMLFMLSSLRLVLRLAVEAAVDRIDVGSNITDGKTLVSAGGSFTLGFFSPPGLPTTKRYLGTWFTFSPNNVYWIANRDHPLNDTSGVLVMSSPGTLQLMDGSQNSIWSSTLTTSASTGARLLETGNFVVQAQNDNGDAYYLWQAFDYPCDTLLPGMKIGQNLWDGDEWYLSSWRSPTDPAPGSYRYVTEPGGGTPENVLWSGTGGDSTKRFRTGPWNGERFGGVPEMASYASNFTYHLTISQSEVTYAYSAKPGAPHDTYSLVKVGDDGHVQRLVWDGSSREWVSFLRQPRDGCDDYGKCGPFGLCDGNAVSTSPCRCLRGFVPASPGEWSKREYSGGCRRNVSLDCSSNQSRTTTDGFQVVTAVKLPDTQSNASVDMGISLDDCRSKCLANCSCVAYAAADIRGGGGGSGCITWTKSFADLRLIEGGQDFYLRLPKSQLSGKADKKKFPVAIVASVVPIGALVLLVGGIIFWAWRRKRLYRSLNDPSPSSSTPASSSAGHLIDYQILKDATNNFSPDKKLGEGSFGTVYQCVLPESESARIGIPVGTTVAVKVLNQSEMNNFERELQVVFGLKHVNLVGLLASCSHRTQDNQGRETIHRILVYEFMQRRGLDLYIFGDRAHRAMLDWERRLKILSAIANGIVHLHENSGSRIIHRDLKPGNILLDDNWDPKVADFGFAKPWNPNPSDPHTSVFCWGYTAPECWFGIITLKWDIFSFGVLLLEIISGELNGPTHRLLSHVWGLWDSSKTLDLLDPAVPPFPEQAEPNLLAKLERCIQIGLLCVQELPEERPHISDIVAMLKGQIPQLPHPRRPRLRRDASEENVSGSTRVYERVGAPDRFSAGETSGTTRTAGLTTAAAAEQPV